jgi:hypothetical protein
MPENRFDALARALGALSDRRVAARTLGAGAFGVLTELAGHDVDAKKKKKKGGKKKKKKKSQCKASQEKCGNGCCNAKQSCIDGTCLGACQFTNDDDLKTMTLQADCATVETILIPDQFTLEGGGKTIHMAGPVSGYQSVTVANTAVRAGLLIQDSIGSVKNLTIDQDALECGGGQAHSAIAMAKGKGDIESVDIVVIRDNVTCYRGIDAEVAANNDVVNVRGVTIAGGHTRAMAISGPTPSDGSSLAAGEIRDCTITDAFFGMLMNGTKHQITGNSVTANFGILVGVLPSNVLIDGNTITGLTGATNPAGILFNPDTKGTASNSAVSGFTCGISVQSNPADVALSGNTFPDPENASDLCFATP